MQLSKEAILSLTKNEDSLIAGIIVSEREHIINQAIDYEHNKNRSDSKVKRVPSRSPDEVRKK